MVWASGIEKRKSAARGTIDMSSTNGMVDLTGTVINFLVVYKTGGDYDTHDYVTKLKNMVHRHMYIPHRFVVLTDNQRVYDTVNNSKNCKAIKLEYGYEGWWSLMEIFRIKGPVVFTGLDTVIAGEIDTLGIMALECPENQIYMLDAFSNRRAKSRWGIENTPDRRWASGIMVWNGSHDYILKNFDYEKHPKEYEFEQRYTATQILENPDVKLESVQDHYEGVRSYKHECKDMKELPVDSKFILFHGLPRPHEVNHLKWMQENWK